MPTTLVSRSLPSRPESLQAGPGHQREHQTHRPKRQNGDVHGSQNMHVPIQTKQCGSSEREPDHDEKNEEQLKHGPARMRTGRLFLMTPSGVPNLSGTHPDSPTSVLQRLCKCRSKCRYETCWKCEE